MTVNQFNRALDQLGFTQVGFARKLEPGERSVRRWGIRPVAGTDAGRDAVEPDDQDRLDRE
ncbi:hypothetical protein HAP41_0000022310 [Bradyrhizobium barranii subsp. apii]|uniref:Uncharacterized protein n=1 Tax=Bradyrhizobium barranii subsp. apii TaxID=2819348 RepID=A0A8T5VEF0_9BRAD|nr:hypothetical protein [Bradyrhizobium barranii]UPT91415.1 hypothetical protein HAP41_0000022310 [Bradyrhizobium barranii subsp. apii]